MFTSRYHQEQAESRRRCERLLNSLKFPEMNERRNHISSQIPDSFTWIFGSQHPGDYNDIYGDDSEDEGRESDDGMLEEDSHSDASSICISHIEGRWDDFVSWLECDDPVYWVSGKPASGKSTLMKFIASNPRTRESLEKWQEAPMILSHFF